MNYLSTNEIATLWGVSRKTVTRYASEGKIPGAMLVGRTWMIPEGAEAERLNTSNGNKGVGRAKQTARTNQAARAAKTSQAKQPVRTNSASQADQAARAARTNQASHPARTNSASQTTPAAPAAQAAQAAPAAPGQAQEFRFPLYVCCDFFNLKDSLENPEELRLYSAYECVMADDFEKANLVAEQLCIETKDIHLRIACLYVMCRCCFYLGKYPTFMEHVSYMRQLFSEDFPHKKEMELLLIDVEGYYKGLDSLLNFSFDSFYDYSSDAYPTIIMMSLYRQIMMSSLERHEIDTTVYELVLRGCEKKGCVFPVIALSSYLALLYHGKGQDQVAYLYIKKAFELVEQYGGYTLLVDVYMIHPKLVRDGLAHYGMTLSEGFKRHFKNYRLSFFGLMAYLDAPTSIFSFSSDDYDYIFYAVNKFTNKEIAAEKHITESAVSKRYEKLCRNFSVGSKKELAAVFLETLEDYGKNRS